MEKRTITEKLVEKDLKELENNSNEIKSLKEQSLVENQSLDDEILKAKRSESYLFCITRKNGDKLTHSWFTNRFDRKDIPIALVYFSESLKREMGATITEETKISESERQLPPEYRKSLDISLKK